LTVLVAVIAPIDSFIHAPSPQLCCRDRIREGLLYIKYARGKGSVMPDEHL
jgi:hypothetical protein